VLHNPNQALGRGAVANFHIKRDTTLALRIPWKVELRRVVYDQDTLMLDRPTSGLPKMRRQDGLGRNAIVPEKTVCRFELRVVERLRKALARSLGQLIGQKTQPPIESVVAEVSLAQFHRDRRYLCALAGHTRTELWPMISLSR